MTCTPIKDKTSTVTIAPVARETCFDSTTAVSRKQTKRHLIQGENSFQQISSLSIRMHRSLNAAGVFSGYIYSEVPRYLPDYEPNTQARCPGTPMYTTY